jgi:RND superfamily putative drug exporter
LEQIRDRLNREIKNPARTSSKSKEDQQDLIAKIHTYADRGIGALLVSNDSKSTLVTIDLATDFQDSANWQIVEEVEKSLRSYSQGTEMPKGLNLAVTGSAALGRDISSAEAYAAKHTGPWTIGMVVILLLVIYRAPLLALVPLLTLFIAVDVSLNLLIALAQHDLVPLFKGLKEYTTVLTYGPGVDYCLFLIARYKENLQECVSQKEALPKAVGQVGAAITASATTVICGVGMLTFAQFGKFHEAGIGISIALLVTLLATLTITPAILAITGHWVFWPKPGIQCDDQARKAATEGQVSENPIVQQNLFAPMWTYLGKVIGRYPVGVLTVTIGCMVPFMVLGLARYNNVNYGLFESLPRSAPSYAGARVLEKGFPAGITGPVQVLLENQKIDFRTQDGIDVVHELADRIMKRKDELAIDDIRSVANPLGMHPTTSDDRTDDESFQKSVEQKVMHRQSVDHYVSSASGVDGHITEMDVILTSNPFSIESTRILDRLVTAVQDELPSEQKSTTHLSFVGPTASVRDLKLINHNDQRRIFTLVVTSVFIILVAILRSISISAYLLLTVLFSYISTLGVTWLFFYSLEPNGFIGLDWTVPIFLFVVLIAIGEDYNIFLVTRIHEEQEQNGPLPGIQIALARTGGIITSCGFIMAGTFASLSFGSLIRMQQLGFALAFGVLLDTFVIRPILVPAFLNILNDQRYGNVIRYLK